jgi:hypothetical protein
VASRSIVRRKLSFTNFAPPLQHLMAGRTDCDAYDQRNPDNYNESEQAADVVRAVEAEVTRRACNRL